MRLRGGGSAESTQVAKTQVLYRGTTTRISWWCGPTTIQPAQAPIQWSQQLAPRGEGAEPLSA